MSGERSVFNLKQSDIVTMVEQYLEEEPGQRPAWEIAKQLPVSLVQFMSREFGMQLRHVGQFEGEEDYAQV